MKYSPFVSLLPTLLVATLVLFAPADASSEVERRGEWPAQEKISLSLDDTPRREAVERLAEVAGWSLVAEGLNDVPVSVDVRDQPADKVLTLLLSGGDFVVERDGTLVSVRPGSLLVDDDSPKRIQSPSGDPGEDLFITEEGHVGKDQTVRDLFVVGTAVVEGTVTGSVVVFGGKAKLVRGARVSQDVIAFGGSIEVEDGVDVGGDVAAFFGTMRRGDGPSKECVTCVEHEEEPWQKFFGEIFSNLTRAVMAWLLGALVLVMAARRMNLLRKELEQRPLRSLGLGVIVFLSALVLIVTLVFTLLGIPLAILSAVAGVVVTYVAFTALPLAVGGRLIGKRSTNPYVHLAVGCGVLFLLLCIPVVGALTSIAGVFMALGALFSTRAAGLFSRAGRQSIPSDD